MQGNFQAICNLVNYIFLYHFQMVQLREIFSSIKVIKSEKRTNFLAATLRAFYKSKLKGLPLMTLWPVQLYNFSGKAVGPQSWPTTS